MYVQKISKSRKEKIKTVKIITEQHEHHCTDDCFNHLPQTEPRGLRKLNLGTIYQDENGRYYHKWGKNDWLEVTGITLSSKSNGEMCLIFEPRHQLHIHSRGGRTIAQTTKQQEVLVNEDYHAVEAAKKLKRKKFNLRDSHIFLLPKRLR